MVPVTLAPGPDRPVVVVGAGISGISCARVLHDAGVPVRVLDRGRRVGGRMAVRTEQLPDGPHPVDIGASYFTVSDDRFAEVVRGWEVEGLARPWTDTFHLLSPDGVSGTRTSVVRWAATGGLRSLVERLAAGLDVTQRAEVAEVGVAADGPMVDGVPASAVVLAMPEPQARDLVPDAVAAELDLGAGMEWLPSIAVWAAWDERWWPELDGAFVDGSPVLSWIADDGRRRGDGAAVLVAHTTALFAAGRLDDPGSAAGPALDELSALLARAAGRAQPAPEPTWLRVHRWSLAAPRRAHGTPFGLTGHGIGACGDAWGGKSRVEQAWLSGRLLGEELLRRVG